MFWIFRRRKKAEITAFELERDIMHEAYRTYMVTLDKGQYVPEKMLDKDCRSIAKIKRKIRKKLWRKNKRDIGFWALPAQDIAHKKFLDTQSETTRAIELVKTQTQLDIVKHERVELLSKIATKALQAPKENNPSA